METQCTYFTRRAFQERTKAADASSPEARKVHLELALRLVRVATQPPSPAVPEGVLHVTNDRDTVSGMDVSDALAGAFPLRPCGNFEQLLDEVDSAERRNATHQSGVPLRP